MAGPTGPGFPPQARQKDALSSEFGPRPGARNHDAPEMPLGPAGSSAESEPETAATQAGKADSVARALLAASGTKRRVLNHENRARAR